MEQQIAVNWLSVFFGLQYTSAGALPAEHPAEPRTSIREPVLRSVIHALMMIDALSDLALTRSLLEVVRSHRPVWLCCGCDNVRNHDTVLSLIRSMIPQHASTSGVSVCS